MASWPDLTEYHEALQHPQRSFSDAALKSAVIELDRFGMPKPATGGNAVVYKGSEGGRTWAIRCFLRPISDHAERYASIAKHLQKRRLAYGTKFGFLDEGVRIRGAWFPIVKMEWVEGHLFHRYVEASLDEPKRLGALRERWRQLVRELEDAKIAHGDLQHGNILVREGDLLLVDYDGMWVPALNGRKATEVGHRAYQHPHRSEVHYGPYLDRFPALVVYLSLLALEHDRSLWEQYHTGDNLLFVREDFKPKMSTEIWSSLAALDSEPVSRLAGVLAACLERQPIDVPTLESILKGSVRIAAKRLPATAAAGKRRSQGARAGAALPAWLQADGASAMPIAEQVAHWKLVWARPGVREEVRWKPGLNPTPSQPVKALAAPPPSPAGGASWRPVLGVAGLVASVAIAWKMSVLVGLVVGGVLLAIALAGKGKKTGSAPLASLDDEDDDGTEFRETVRVRVPGMNAKVAAVYAAGDGRQLAVVAADGECGFWDVAADTFKACRGKLAGVRLGAAAGGSAKVAVVAGDHDVSVWDLASWVKTPCPTNGGSKVHAVALTPDGSRAAIGASWIQIVDVRARRVIGELSDAASPVRALAFGDDGQLLVSATRDGALRLARVSPRVEPIREVKAAHKGPVTSLAIAAKAKLVAVGDERGKVSFWSRDLEHQLTVDAGKSAVASLCFVGDNDPVLAVGLADGSLKLLAASGGRILSSLQLTGAVTALAFAKSKPGLAVGTSEGHIALIAIH